MPDETITPEQADATAEDAIINLFRTVSQGIAVPMGTDPVPSPAGRRIRITGVCVDAESGEAVEGVTLGFGGETEAKTNEKGEFVCYGPMTAKTEEKK